MQIKQLIIMLAYVVIFGLNGMDKPKTFAPNDSIHYFEQYPDVIITIGANEFTAPSSHSFIEPYSHLRCTAHDGKNKVAFLYCMNYADFDVMKHEHFVELYDLNTKEIRELNHSIIRSRILNEGDLCSCSGKWDLFFRSDKGSKLIYKTLKNNEIHEMEWDVN